MDIKNKVTLLFELMETVKINGIPVSSSPRYPEILSMAREIICFFGLSSDVRFEHELIRLVYHTSCTERSVDRVIQTLTETAAAFLADLYPAGDTSNDNLIAGTRQEEDDEVLDKSLDLAWQSIKAKREKENQANSRGENTRPISGSEVKDYVTKHLYLSLTDQEFENIETGFSLRWNYSYGQVIGDADFKLSVDKYLVSIESPMDRKKMNKVVDLILEYLEETGQFE